MFVLLLLIKVNKLLFFLKKNTTHAPWARRIFSKSFGATFQSYFREDKKLT